MREETIKVYQFKELKKEIKSKVIEYFRSKNDYYFLSEFMKTELDLILKQNKISGDPTLYYSLSYSQGDGVCFEGVFKWKNNYKVYIKHSGNYYHYNSVDIEIRTKADYDAKQEVYDTFKGIYIDICREMEKIGYNYIEYEDTEEYIINEIECNEYEFLENGDLF